MAKLYNILTKENKDKLAKIFEQLMGKKFTPKRDNFPETLSKIDKFMREKPRSGRE